MVQNQEEQNSHNFTETTGKTSTAKLEKKPVQMNRNIKLKEIQDQVIVITGASSGIGLVTARMAASQGAKLVLAARNEEALQQLVDELRNQGNSAVYVKADVGNENDINKIAETAINEYGRFDTWVNNAGVTIYGHAMDVSTEDMKRMFQTNFWGVVYGSKAAVKHFKERGVPGALINVGSLFGGKGDVLQSTYSAAKFAVHGWTDSIRMELEKENAPVSVTLIHPGRIDTPYNEHARSYLDKQPAHKGMIYPPEAVADAILFSAANPKRDMYIGSQAKIYEWLGSLMPRLTDKLVEWYLYPTQHDSRPSKTTRESALYHKGYGMHERGTNKGWMRSNSMYVKASKRPMLTLALAGGAAVAYSVMKKRK
ncbi:Short-chain dehydrogenase [Gracilibacillus ureilyticus]|uniref:Short-chain dehydrogenase n=1 Tax=Gracilibacillus ureilyticus TaxID=531814 RepID=A0A1H9W367_9BACI|nr:SDR family oxidoreductase [Gracilibacillus ureilyticus]SES28345.1 Short-chain dehydrogenase [Gracilibacillus ureilyticus]